MSNDFRIDETGIAWQRCPACGQDVIPSHNGWREHQPYCPGRRKIMAAFGVTEDDMTAMDRIEELNGYTAAKKAADWQRAVFASWIAEITKDWA
jgi:hypothetical protein